jgi:hypothetical protein
VELTDDEWNELRAYIEPLASKLVREARTENGGNVLASLVALQVASFEMMESFWKEFEPVEASRLLVLSQQMLARYAKER